MLPKLNLSKRVGDSSEEGYRWHKGRENRTFCRNTNGIVRRAVYIQVPMLLQTNIRKESVSFPILDGDIDSRSEAESGAEQQDVVAISFRPGKEQEGDEYDSEEAGEELGEDCGDSEKTNSNGADMEDILTRLFDKDHTDLSLILDKAACFEDEETNKRVLDHLQKLKSLSNELYQKKYDVDQRTYLCYMTTTTKDLSEIDGVILRHYYLEKFVWKSDLLSSLRVLCSRLFFKGESQNIDIMIHAFANNWFSRFNQPSFIYGNIIGVYLVTYALILLNTDLHNDQIISSLRSSSQQTLAVSSTKITRKKSGSLFDIFSHDTSSSIAENDSEGSKCMITCITKNQFVMNTIAALNDNFVIVNPLIMRKQLRLYYSNVKSHEILLPKFDIETKLGQKDATMNGKKIESGTKEDAHALSAEESTANDILIVGEDPNDEVTELRTLASLKPTSSLPSVASTRMSFEVVSGTIKETVGSFGFLKETEKHETSAGLDTIDITDSPIVKEGLQKILVNDLYVVADRNYERYNSSALLFKDVPEVHLIAAPSAPQTLRRKKSLIDRIMKSRRNNRPENDLTTAKSKRSTTTPRRPNFKFAECFVAICDGELRIFEFDKNPDKVNSYSGHGRGEWTDWAQCLASVSLAGCYAEVIGKSRRKSSREEKEKLTERFGDRVYWKLELPYSMMELVNDQLRDSELAGVGSDQKVGMRRSSSRREREQRSERREKFEKMIFSAYSEETAAEFVKTCNYWAGMQSKVPNVKTQFFDEMKLTSFEYGFSDEIVELITRLAETIPSEGISATSSTTTERKELVDTLRPLLLSEKGIAEWRPIVHSCVAVAEPVSARSQVREIARYMDELSGAFCHERRLLQLVRTVYNKILLHHESRPLLEAVLTVYENYRAACLSLLRERRRWRVQRCVLLETAAGGKEQV